MCVDLDKVVNIGLRNYIDFRTFVSDLQKSTVIILFENKSIVIPHIRKRRKSDIRTSNELRRVESLVEKLFNFCWLG